MATQVEVGSTLTSLANLSELMNEAKLQRAFASPLSGAGSQPGELPSPLSPLLLEERGPFGNPLRPTTMTPATSRPRLTPKPFCREKSAETFAIVKPPVPALKPSNVAPKPSVFAKTFEDMSVVRGLTGNVPPLVDQKLVESKASSDLVANMPFYSSPQANTVILFETGSTDRVRMTLTPDKNIVGVPRTLSTLPAQEGKLSSSKSEVSCRRPNSAGIHRQLSLSSESRPGSWNPCRPLERTDTVADAPEKKAKEGGEQPSSHISPASEVQPRLKQRPVSAIFLESLKDQKHCAPDVSDEKPLPEKPWVRKPRPLSVDLTAKFENRDLSVPRKSCQFEVKEKNLVTHFADVGYSRPSEMGPKSETAGLGQADLSTSNLKTAVRIADSPGAKSVIDSQTQKPSPNEIAFSCHSAPKDLGQVSAKDRKYLWERKLKSQDEQIEREMALAAASEKSKEPSCGKGQSVKERTVLNQKEICVVSDASADAERRSSRGGRVKKLLNLSDTPANSAALVNTESPPESPEKESRILNIQQRIKELTAENADAKPGNLRRSVRSRPLSTDLTKLFSSPATSSEVRQAELNRKHFSETQEVHENGPDCREAHVLGPPWKSQKPIKIPQTDGHLEKDGSFVRERQDATLQGEGPPSLADHDLKPHSLAVAENACLKTVRATMFEHSVQRHNVAVDRLGTEPVLQPTPELAGGQLRRDKEPWLEKALENQTVSKKMPSKQADACPHFSASRDATSLNEDTALAVANWEKYMTKEKLEKPTQKHIEDSLKYQRIEPRYEILQMVGERVQSEAIAAVSEDKAMTLRSRRSWKERRKTEEGVSWPCSPDLKGDGWREDGLVSKMKDPGEAAVKTTSMKAHNVSHSQQVFHEPELNESQTRQQRVTVKASYFPNRNKDLGTADDIVSSLSSELEKEKPEVCFADHMEGSKLLKHFPESFGAGQGRTDGNEARAYVGENMASAKAVEHESPSSQGGTSQWQKLSHKASHPIVDTTTYEQEDPKVLGLRKLAPAYCAKEELDVSGCLVEGERFVQLDVEERIRRGARGVSAPKATERWRRKTLPHGAARFEDAGAVAQESAKPLSRRDSLQLHNSSIAKKNREPGCGAEPREGGAASPGHPGGSQKHQLSPSEPKATYFTDTVQGPVENENASNPLKSKPISSVVENTSLHPNASTSRRSHRQHNRRFPDTPGSLDRHLSKSWGEGGTMDFPGPGGYKYERSDARCENKRSLERHLDDAKERSTRVDPLCQAEPKSPSCLRHFPQDRECSGQQKCSCCSQDITKGKSTGGYRSRVLDIDALMAEYKEDSKREGSHSEESSLFPWENLVCRRNSLDKTSGSYNSNNPKGLDHSPRSTRQGFSATEFRWPENVHANEQEKGDCCSQESSPRKARDMTFSPPHWGRLFAEKPKYLPTDPISKRKKTFIIDEEQGESLMLRHHSAKYASGNLQAVGSIRVDTEPGVGCAPHPSQVLPGGVYLSKGMSPKQQASVRSEEDCCHETVHARGLNKRKGGTAVSCLETDASRAEARAEWNSSASGLANAPLDLKRSYSEKVRQARVRSSLPSGPEVKEGVHQSSLPERVDGWLGKRSTSQQDSSFHGEKRQDLEKEQSKQGRGSSGVRSPPYLPVQRRSHSFYKERRTDHWATDQLRECFGRPAVEAKDTDTLVQEADSQYGTWNDQRHSGDSFVPESPSSESNVASSAQKLPSSRLSSFSQTDPASVADQRDSSRDQRSTSLDQSSTDVDSADGTEGPAPAEACPDFSFLDPTPVLDSSALKTRVQLSKRRRQHRAPISHSLRRSTGGETGLRLSVPEEVDSAWMFQDCTEVKSAKTDDSDEEEKTTRPVERSPSSQPQRLPVFPGMDHSVLKAQLRKRQEMEGTGDSSPAQLSKSSKSPFQARALGGRVLPTGVEKEERPEEQSPQWLRELKSKKRQSQYENQV